MTMTLRIMDLSEFLKDPPTTRNLIIAELRTAADLLEKFSNGDRDDSAAWRVADAGYKLRLMMETDNWIGAQGFDQKTGIGVMLPNK